MDKIAVLILAIVLIVGIIWWFFGKKQTDATDAEQQNDLQVATVIVDGGYNPSVISLQKDKPTNLIFIRKDPSGCLEEVIMPDFGISTHLPVNEPYTVSFTPKENGIFTYTCGMRMFSGQIEVK